MREYFSFVRSNAVSSDELCGYESAIALAKLGVLKREFTWDCDLSWFSDLMGFAVLA